MKAWTIVGYVYAAAALCPTCTIEGLIGQGRLAPGARGMREEDALDQLAAVEGIDRQDEHSYDSDDFPKVIFASDVEGESCGACRTEL